MRLLAMCAGWAYGSLSVVPTSAVYIFLVEALDWSLELRNPSQFYPATSRGWPPARVPSVLLGLGREPWGIQLSVFAQSAALLPGLDAVGAPLQYRLYPASTLFQRSS